MANILKKKIQKQREIEQLTKQNQEIEKAIIKEAALDLKPEIQPQEVSKIEQNITSEIEKEPQKTPISIEELLSDNVQRQSKNSQEMNSQGISVESLLKRQREQQKELEKEPDERSKLNVEDLLNHQELDREKGLSRDQGGFER